MSKLHLSIVCFEMYKKNAFREYLILSLKFKWDFVLINSRFTLGHNLICVQTELSKLTLASVRNSQNVSFYSINMHGVAWNLFNEKWKMKNESYCPFFLHFIIFEFNQNFSMFWVNYAVIFLFELFEWNSILST